MELLQKFQKRFQPFFMYKKQEADKVIAKKVKRDLSK